MQTITGLSPNTSYVLTIDAKGVSGTGRGYIYVKDYGDAQINKSIISDNSFHNTSIIFVTGPNSTSANIGAYDTAGRVQLRLTAACQHFQSASRNERVVRLRGYRDFVEVKI